MNFIVDIFKDLSQSASVAGTAFSYTWFIILPIVLFYLFKVLWMDLIQNRFANEKLKPVMLEIIPPRNIEKSPQPMESLYTGISGVLKTLNAFEEYIDGEITPRFSHEIAGDGGKVKFYIRTPGSYRNLIEAHLYAQYPDVVIQEAPDYTEEMPRVIPNEEYELWGTDFELARPDPYPIRSYKFYEEDVTGKMIDPLAGLVEMMGTLMPGERLWLQYIVIPIKETRNEEERKIVQELAGRIKKRKGNIFSDLGDVLSNVGRGLFGQAEFAEKEKEQEQPLEFRLTPVEKDVLKAVENNIGQCFFEVKMRYCYIAKKELFNKANGVSSFFGAMKQFNDINLNSFKPVERTKTKADFIFINPRLRFKQRRIYSKYVKRDPTGKRVVLSSEELATVYHMLDMSVVAPSVTFVEAKRGGAPANLPVG